MRRVVCWKSVNRDAQYTLGAIVVGIYEIAEGDFDRVPLLVRQVGVVAQVDLGALVAIKRYEINFGGSSGGAACRQ